jgi:hypothetical protein
VPRDDDLCCAQLSIGRLGGRDRTVEVVEHGQELAPRLLTNDPLRACKPRAIVGGRHLGLAFLDVVRSRVRRHAVVGLHRASSRSGERNDMFASADR